MFSDVSCFVVGCRKTWDSHGLALQRTDKVALLISSLHFIGCQRGMPHSFHYTPWNQKPHSHLRVCIQSSYNGLVQKKKKKHRRNNGTSYYLQCWKQLRHYWYYEGLSLRVCHVGDRKPHQLYCQLQKGSSKARNKQLAKLRWAKTPSQNQYSSLLNFSVLWQNPLRESDLK